MLCARVGSTAVGAGWQVEARGGLMGGSPCGAGCDVSVHVVSGFLHAGEGDLHEVAVDVRESSGVVAFLPRFGSAVFVAPIGRHLAQMRPRRIH